MARRADLGFTLVFLAIVAIVVHRAATAAGPIPLRVASSEERARLAKEVAGYEDEWRAHSAKEFPADAWSARDDFHGQELRFVREQAARQNVSVEQIYRAIDEDIHASRASSGGPDRSADVVPLKPRPVFD